MDHTTISFADCPTGDEGQLLLFALDRVHRQFAWKSGGLDAEQLHRQHPPSELTMAGLIKHLAAVEATWTARAQGLSPGTPWSDRDEDPQWDWQTALTDNPAELSLLWYDTVARARASWAELVADGGLDITVPWDGEDYRVNRRRVLMDILEENLLHTGQASMLREAIDGLTGNDPP